MPDQLESEIKTIIAEILELKPADIPTDISLHETTMQVDSVAMLEILVTLERRYQIAIKEEEIKSITDWQSLIELIRAKKKA